MSSLNDSRFDLLINNDRPEPDVSTPTDEELDDSLLLKGLLVS